MYRHCTASASGWHAELLLPDILHCSLSLVPAQEAFEDDYADDDDDD